MRRERLRPAPGADELARMYAVPHDHRPFRDHHARVAATIRIAGEVMGGVRTIADLSCGDAAIAMALQASHGAQLALGDIAPGYEFHGPIEQTVLEIEPVDLFVCSETVEHLDDPDTVLRDIRAKTRYPVLSTPEGEFDQGNPQHLHGFDAEAVGAMLAGAGFTPMRYELLDMRPQGFMYAFQIWLCK